MSTIPKGRRTSRKQPPPPLHNGDRLTQAEFHRRTDDKLMCCEKRRPGRHKAHLTLVPRPCEGS
jgi:hypothetical protein